MNEEKFVIAIDGPVASGKGTIASRLAQELHGLYLYTGAMYRIVALASFESNIDLNDESLVVSLLPKISISYDGEKVFFNGRDVTERIKEQDTANGASIVGVYPQVRAALVQMQQQIGRDAISKGKIVVTEGRDTATKVFPDALVKIYLTATDEIRAKRRLLQYEQKGAETTLQYVLEEIAERDKRDRERATDPLPSNPQQVGYTIIDNSTMSEEETLHAIKAVLVRVGVAI